MGPMKKLRSQPQPPPVPLAPSTDKHTASPGPVTTAANGASADWRELARRIQQETDSGVMLELVQELITKLDQEKSRTLGGKQK